MSSKVTREMALTEKAISTIKHMISSGELRPGQRLPPEKELAALLGLSRNSLREAVKALEIINVLEVRRGDGTFVTSLEPRLLLEAMSFSTEVHDAEFLLQVMGTRRVLEFYAVTMAVPHIGPETIARLRASIASVEDHEDVDALVKHDMEFHQLIISFCGNDYMASLIESLSGRTLRARTWRGLTQHGSVERTLFEHEQLVDAIAAGDALLAGTIVSAHISGVEQWLRHAGQEQKTSDVDTHS
ncbi:FadR/GntR family transcriptional regulator [Devosia sp.]|uniref:FadR/GntR family transcriptional regulator n=2 Tax=unclassified Devosia TaxID=196773 RepID=UPI000B3024D6|nr:FadR/GntR family transcriptional regulator [Devosia sp.]